MYEQTAGSFVHAFRQFADCMVEMQKAVFIAAGCIKTAFAVAAVQVENSFRDYAIWLFIAFQEVFDNFVPLSEKVPDLLLHDLREVEAAVRAEEAAEVDRHGIFHLGEESVESFVYGIRGEDGLSVFQDAGGEQFPKSGIGPEAFEHLHALCVQDGGKGVMRGQIR